MAREILNTTVYEAQEVYRVLPIVYGDGDGTTPSTTVYSRDGSTLWMGCLPCEQYMPCEPGLVMGALTFRLDRCTAYEDNLCTVAGPVYPTASPGATLSVFYNPCPEEPFPGAGYELDPCADAAGILGSMAGCTDKDGKRLCVSGHCTDDGGFIFDVMDDDETDYWNSGSAVLRAGCWRPSTGLVDFGAGVDLYEQTLTTNCRIVTRYCPAGDPIGGNTDEALPQDDPE